jgi:hypothetical protein
LVPMLTLLFETSVLGIYQGTLPLPPHRVLLTPHLKSKVGNILVNLDYLRKIFFW